MQELSATYILITVFGLMFIGAVLGLFLGINIGKRLHTDMEQPENFDMPEEYSIEMAHAKEIDKIAKRLDKEKN